MDDEEICVIIHRWSSPSKSGGIDNPSTALDVALMINGRFRDEYKVKVFMLDYKPGVYTPPRGKKDMDIEICGTKKQLKIFAESTKTAQVYYLNDRFKNMTDCFINSIRKKIDK